jgi:cytochrome d ubiquinol oxidase subunit II
MGPDDVLLVSLCGAVTLYALLGGADFGAGVWQAWAGRRAGPREREQVHAAVGPVWEANHVWLVFAFVVLLTAFPTALEAVARALWLPLLLALAGIVLRGAGFAFRPRDPARKGEARAWEALFGGASVAAPFFLGASLGALAEGRLAVTRDGGFDGTATSWVSPLSLWVGAMAVGICALLAAAYLARESSLARDAEMLEVWRRRATWAGVVDGVLAVGGVAVVATTAPDLWDGFRARSLPFVAVSAVGGVGSVVALVARRFTAAAAGAALAVSCVLWGWFAARHPYLVPPAITAESARAPRATLVAAAWTVVVGGALVAPSTLALLRVFKSERAARVGRSKAGSRPRP